MVCGANNYYELVTKNNIATVIKKNTDSKALLAEAFEIQITTLDNVIDGWNRKVGVISQNAEKLKIFANAINKEAKLCSDINELSKKLNRNKEQEKYCNNETKDTQRPEVDINKIKQLADFNANNLDEIFKKCNNPKTGKTAKAISIHKSSTADGIQNKTLDTRALEIFPLEFNINNGVGNLAYIDPDDGQKYLAEIIQGPNSIILRRKGREDHYIKTIYEEHPCRIVNEEHIPEDFSGRFECSPLVKYQKSTRRAYPKCGVKINGVAPSCGYEAKEHVEQAQ